MYHSKVNSQNNPQNFTQSIVPQEPILITKPTSVNYVNNLMVLSAALENNHGCVGWNTQLRTPKFLVRSCPRRIFTGTISGFCNRSLKSHKNTTCIPTLLIVSLYSVQFLIRHLLNYLFPKSVLNEPKFQKWLKSAHRPWKANMLMSSSKFWLNLASYRKICIMRHCGCILV